MELKKFIQECDVNLAKMKLEVDCVAWYLKIFEVYGHDIPFEYIENFYVLKTYPSEVKMAVMEGQRVSNS